MSRVVAYAAVAGGFGEGGGVLGSAGGADEEGGGGGERHDGTEGEDLGVVAFFGRIAMRSAIVQSWNERRTLKDVSGEVTYSPRLLR